MTDDFHGEFSDSRAKQLEDDPRVEVLDVEDGKWGLDEGTKHVTFRLRGDSGFAEYQKQTEETAIYPDTFPEFVTPGLVYVCLGLAEAGEVQEKLKKAIREDDVSYLEDIPAELGDVLWYAARIPQELSEIDAVDFDGNFADVAEANLDKLFDRKDRGVLEGEGDDR